MSIATVSNMVVLPEAEVLDEVFREYYSLIYRTAYGVTGSIEDAEDIAQTILLQILRHEIAVATLKNPKGYVYRTAVNLSLGIVRGRQRFVAEQDLEKISGAGEADAPIRSEAIHRKLYEAVGKLQPKAAEILILRYVHNYSDAEIAKILGTSRGTIAVNLHRSRATMPDVTLCR